MRNKAIQINNLKKNYQVYKKEPGVSGSLKSIFNRKYFDVKAVDGISFEIGESELVGFIGPNGAGKTTTLKMLAGLLYPSSGNIEVLGSIPSERKPEFQKQFSLIMGQKNQLWWDLPIWESLLLNKAIYEIPDDRFKKVVGELSELLELTDYLHIQARKLSLGQRMKSELLVALLHTPKMLFLDEPTIGLDVVAQKKMRDFIKEYNNRYGATVILTSHYMDDVKELCDRIIMIDKGKVVFDDKLQRLTQKYANYKTLIVIFNSKVEREDLEPFGEVTEYSYPKVVLKVPREKSSNVAASLLTKFDIDDLNINEPELEDVIRMLFTQGFN